MSFCALSESVCKRVGLGASRDWPLPLLMIPTTHVSGIYEVNLINISIVNEAFMSFLCNFQDISGMSEVDRV